MSLVDEFKHVRSEIDTKLKQLQTCRGAAVQSVQEKAHMPTALFQGAISAISFSAMLVMFASVIGLVWWLCSTVFRLMGGAAFASGHLLERIGSRFQ